MERPTSAAQYASSDERALTTGEIAMARVIFKSAIAYGKVKIHRGSYFPFGLQSKGTAVAPNGNIYFLPEDYLADFSAGTVYDKRWLIHELTHVWQYQLGYPVRLRGAVRIGLDYDYVLTKDKRLGDYNMEAQGDILADYFALLYLKAPGIVHHRVDGKTPTLADYEHVLQDFIANPSDKKNLP